MLQTQRFDEKKFFFLLEIYLNTEKLARLKMKFGRISIICF